MSKIAVRCHPEIVAMTALRVPTQPSTIAAPRYLHCAVLGVVRCHFRQRGVRMHVASTPRMHASRTSSIFASPRMSLWSNSYLYPQPKTGLYVYAEETISYTRAQPSRRRGSLHKISWLDATTGLQTGARSRDGDHARLYMSLVETLTGFDDMRSEHCKPFAHAS